MKEQNKKFVKKEIFKSDMAWRFLINVRFTPNSVYFIILLSMYNQNDYKNDKSNFRTK